MNFSKAKFFVFVNNSFANNKNLNFQLGYKIILANEIIRKKKFTIERNIIYYNFIKSKQITRNILVSKLYNIINDINITIFINTIIKIIIK